MLISPSWSYSGITLISIPSAHDALGKYYFKPGICHCLHNLWDVVWFWATAIRWKLHSVTYICDLNDRHLQHHLHWFSIQENFFGLLQILTDLLCSNSTDTLYKNHSNTRTLGDEFAKNLFIKMLHNFKFAIFHKSKMSRFTFVDSQLRITC